MSLTSVNIAKIVLKSLETLCLDLKYLVGVCTGGAAALTSSSIGAQSKLKENAKI